MDSNRTVDPADVIVETIESTQTRITHVNPWARATARFFDYAVFFILLGLAHRSLQWDFLPTGYYAKVIPVNFLLWIPIESLLLCTLGTTPGRWLLRTKVRDRAEKKPDFTTALRRSFTVWVRGLGLGIPGINIFCMLFAYQRLLIAHTTSWDREGHTRVTHYPLARWRLPVTLFCAVGGLSAYYAGII